MRPGRNQPDKAEHVESDRKPNHFGRIVFVRGSEKAPQEDDDEISRQTEQDRVAWCSLLRRDVSGRRRRNV